MKIARVYLRVSTIEQRNQRQEKIIDEAMDNGYYIAKVYREQASGTIKDRPKLRELISDLQSGEVIIAENIDRQTAVRVMDCDHCFIGSRDFEVYLCIRANVRKLVLKLASFYFCIYHSFSSPLINIITL